jgi:hypothetical protein
VDTSRLSGLSFFYLSPAIEKTVIPFLDLSSLDWSPPSHRDYRPRPRAALSRTHSKSWRQAEAQMRAAELNKAKEGD